MSELAKRVAVAAVGIPTVLGLAFLGGWYLAIPLALFAALGCHEVARFARQKGVRSIEPLGIAMAVALVLAASWHPTFPSYAPWALGVLVAGSGVALVVSLGVRGASEAPLMAVSVTLLGAVYVGGALAFASLLHALPSTAGWEGGQPSPWAGLVAVALPLAVTWVGDAAAFFAGTAWGKAKLAPSISPNKSWVGFWAAVVGGAAAAAVWLVVARSVLEPLVGGPAGDGAIGAGNGGAMGLVVMAGVGALLACLAVVGDLVESLLKREAGVKDSGTFFPGHGGVMDRIDSLLFTIPISYVALLLLGGLP
ncbi:MAG: phosphatidate cytidylyltransferase [Gemmatimonadetes bacterium]|nr:phosphatidate cytidylyltransferase [Gemmatimonadota bacterium]